MGGSSKFDLADSYDCECMQEVLFPSLSIQVVNDIIAGISFVPLTIVLWWLQRSKQRAAAGDEVGPCVGGGWRRACAMNLAPQR